MNCEQVRELLSAYLDNKLAREERQEVAIHLQACAECSTLLANFHHFDTLIASLPRVSPDPALYDKIFSSPEYLELTGTADASRYSQMSYNRPTDRPRLVALPGGRHPFSHSASSETNPAFPIVVQHKHRGLTSQRVMQAMIAACLLLTLGVAGFISWNVLHQQNQTSQSPSSFIPPAGPSQGPIPAGLRFVFLRDAALWSAPTDGGTGIMRLTPPNIMVATDWAVRPALPGRTAGNMLAYIDLQQGLIHIIRSDAQNDTIVHQPLLKIGISPSSVWDTEAGTIILNSLSWSKDGSMLAFVADATATPELYLYAIGTGEIQAIALPQSGAVSHPVWSPDGMRIAFELINNSGVSILDYNTQNRGMLTIASAINTSTGASDRVLSLDWSSSTDAPALTWSVGTAGHVHSIWSQRVGAETTSQPHMLLEGDYAQATYNRSGHTGKGSWLIVKWLNGQPSDLLSVDIGGSIVQWTNGKQVSSAQWCPDGTQISYFESVSAGIGALHVLRVQNASDTLVAVSVTADPAPSWSPDSQKLVYSTSSYTLIASVQNIRTSQPLKLQGPASAFSWSTSSPSQLVLATNDGQPGIYLVDIQHNTALRLDQVGLRGPILWTFIP